MKKQSLSKWKHYQPDIILLTWYAMRQQKYLNHIIEQDRRFIKKRVFLWEKSFKNQKEFIHQLFGFTA